MLIIGKVVLLRVEKRIEHTFFLKELSVIVVVRARKQPPKFSHSVESMGL